MMNDDDLDIGVDLDDGNLLDDDIVTNNQKRRKSTNFVIDSAEEDNEDIGNKKWLESHVKYHYIIFLKSRCYTNMLNIRYKHL